jgi:hypothetical protein
MQKYIPTYTIKCYLLEFVFGGSVFTLVRCTYIYKFQNPSLRVQFMTSVYRESASYPSAFPAWALACTTLFAHQVAHTLSLRIVSAPPAVGTGQKERERYAPVRVHHFAERELHLGKTREKTSSVHQPQTQSLVRKKVLEIRQVKSGPAYLGGNALRLYLYVMGARRFYFVCRHSLCGENRGRRRKSFWSHRCCMGLKGAFHSQIDEPETRTLLWMGGIRKLTRWLAPVGACSNWPSLRLLTASCVLWAACLCGIKLGPN